jgi:5'-3' exonuclease
MKLIIIDTSVILHQILNQALTRWTEVWSPKHEIYLEESIAYINNLGWLPILERHQCKTVWVCDSKPYWRSIFEPEYKGNRPAKHPRYQDALDLFDRISLTPPSPESPKLTRLDFDGYEADDIAAAIVRLWTARNEDKTKPPSPVTQIFLATVDSDWLGLIANRNVFWCCTMSHSPRLRQKEESFNWLQAQWNKQSKKKQKLWEMPHEFVYRPSDIWQWKLAVGDKSDNLFPGCPSFMIDLFAPHHDFDLTLKAESRVIAETIAKAPFIDNTHTTAHLDAICSLGATPPVDTLYIPADRLI